MRTEHEAALDTARGLAVAANLALDACGRDHFNTAQALVGLAVALGSANPADQAALARVLLQAAHTLDPDAQLRLHS